MEGHGSMNSNIYFEKFFSEGDFLYCWQLVSNEKVMIMNYGRVFTMEETNELFRHMIDKSKNYEGFGYFKVFKKESNEYIGLGAVIINDDFTEAEIEYMLLPEYWGEGYGSKVVSNLLNKIDETKSIKKVIAITKPNNIVSKRILYKNGFRLFKIYEVDDGSLAEILIKYKGKI